MSNIDETLKQRGNRYGSFEDNAATVQELKRVLHEHKSWKATLQYTHKESLEMIMHKIARIVNGDPDYDDSWVDIAGYAQLVVNHIKAKQHDTNN